MNESANHEIVEKGSSWWFSFAKRYGIAVASIAVTLLVAIILQRYSISINLTILVVAGLLIPTWYGGKGAGLVVGITFEIVSIASKLPTPDASISNYIFGHVSIMSLYVFLVLIVSARRNAERHIKEQRDRYRTLFQSRKQAGERLREAQERLSSTLLAGSVGTWTWDIVTDRLSGDEFTARMFSLDADAAAKGLPVMAYLDSVFEEDQPNVSAALEKAIESCGSYDIEYRVRQKEGRFSWLQAKGRVDCDGAGNALNFHGAVIDITKPKLAEREVHRLNEQLEQRVLDRTEQLEAANKELESFSYSVSHDLRAPLRHVDGFVQMLTKREAGRLDDTSTRYLKVVSDAVGKMGTLIDELLAFSRTSRVEIKTVRVDLNVLVAQAKSELALAMSGRKIEWQIADLPPVKGDAVLLGIVMTNLLSNAIKYTRGRAEAHIEIGTSGETDREVTIFVKDNGAGFDMKYADKLFGVFQRLHRDDEFEGIGIGLATVQRIVHRHGGRIWAESEPDKGATFYMTLRRKKGETK